MFERLWNAPKVKLAPTDEELKADVKEYAGRPPEEQKEDAATHLDALQHQPSITLTPEEKAAHEEVERLKRLQG